MKKAVIYILVFITIFLFSCEEVIIIGPEPKRNTYPPADLPELNGEMNMEIYAITDNQVELQWKKINNIDEYEIFVDGTNDTYFSRVSYNYQSTIRRVIYGLSPDQEYEISVKATGKDLRYKIDSINVRTCQSLVTDIIAIPHNSYDQAQPDYGFKNIYKTPDDEYIVVGSGMKYGAFTLIVYKFDKYYNIIWRSDIENITGRLLTKIVRCSDGGFLLLTEYVAYKIDKNGTLEWKTSTLEDQQYMNDAIECPDGSFLLGGGFWGGDSIGKYLLIKLSPKGNILHIKKSGNYPRNNIQLLAEGNGKIHAIGQTTINTDDGYRAITIAEFDYDGNLLDEVAYPLVYDDYLYSYQVSKKILRAADGGYYILGDITYSSNYAQKWGSSIIKLNNKFEFISAFQVTPVESDISQNVQITDRGTLVFLYDLLWGGIGICEMDTNGNIIKNYLVRGFPSGRMISIEEDNHYCYLADYGAFIFLNLNGYNYTLN